MDSSLPPPPSAITAAAAEASMASATHPASTSLPSKRPGEYSSSELNFGTKVQTVIMNAARSGKKKRGGGELM